MFNSLTAGEQTKIDQELEGKLEWAETRSAEAEQLSLDASRLLSCTGENLEKVSAQGFFKRCWGSFSGTRASVERANVGDLIQLQKYAWRYISLLQERQLMMAHSMIALRNNLLTLSVQEQEMRSLVAALAQKTLQRFNELERRVDQLEVSSNIQCWVMTLPESDYTVIYPTRWLRMLRVINDYYGYKPGNWNCRDVLLMRTALRSVRIDPRENITMGKMIDGLVDEIAAQGYKKFSDEVLFHAPKNVPNYSEFAVENVSSQVLTMTELLNTDYEGSHEIITMMADQFKTSPGQALKTLLRRKISNMNVDVDLSLTTADAAVELLECMRLTNQLISRDNPTLVQPQVSTAGEDKAAPENSASRCRDVQESTAAKRPSVTVDIPHSNGAESFRANAQTEERQTVQELLDDKNAHHSKTQRRPLKIRVDVAAAELPEVTKLLADGIASQKNGRWQDAAANYRKAAERGNVEAMFRLGWCCEFGFGARKDYSEAAFWYRRAADAGSVEAMARYGVCCECGRGVKFDCSGGVEWYRRAAVAGSAEAMRRLGGCYHSGRGVPFDDEEAVRWYKKSAEAGDGEAMCELGNCCAKGRGGEKMDLFRAQNWYRKGITWCRQKAEEDRAEAMNCLGSCYYFGHGVERNYSEAVKWFRKAAGLGCDAAMKSLGDCWYNAKGVVRDFAEAARWYKKAAEAGNSGAMNALAHCYAAGDGVPKNQDEADRWHERCKKALQICQG